MEPLVEPGRDFETEEDYKGRYSSTLQCIIQYLRRNLNIIYKTLLLLFIFLICISALSIVVHIGQGGLSKLVVEHHCADVKDVIDQTQTDVATRVAFSTYLARDLNNLGPDQTVIFENVTLNDGNAYNPLLGTFHVPQAGLYFFAVTLQSFQICRQWFKLEADRHTQAEFLYYPSGHQMATNTAVLRLKEGQTVRVAVSEEENGVSLQNGYT